ncbi:hypothetical protein PTSG_02378 [Salpingoeca rosetta]|uniref:Sensitive to high expression protein 9, mitochondrial n=1 Tax=Salpingoeca rosetta (strain ATCC 50818 / BSB-021) TaxID=946362 RepID=F2U212_SALR5|nr:uncharacterized protein PTSG_02378 [Salpingoeca rosetta]EGD81664.1 hypothetical protein PTSG_02378 [Salpingoeca rosetta]|eukprot:XP_004996868.1 hypothetical protein PTSG_02378 [Salpingoeca rosetta]
MLWRTARALARSGVQSGGGGGGGGGSGGVVGPKRRKMWLPSLNEEVGGCRLQLRAQSTSTTATTATTARTAAAASTSAFYQKWFQDLREEGAQLIAALRHGHNSSDGTTLSVDGGLGAGDGGVAVDGQRSPFQAKMDAIKRFYVTLMGMKEVTTARTEVEAYRQLLLHKDAELKQRQQQYQAAEQEVLKQEHLWKQIEEDIENQDWLTFAQRQQQKMRARKEWEQDHQHVVNDAIAKEDDMNTCQQQREDALSKYIDALWRCQHAEEQQFEADRNIRYYTFLLSLVAIIPILVFAYSRRWMVARSIRETLSPFLQDLNQTLELEQPSAGRGDVHDEDTTATAVASYQNTIKALEAEIAALKSTGGGEGQQVMATALQHDASALYRDVDKLASMMEEDRATIDTYTRGTRNAVITAAVVSSAAFLYALGSRGG